jgi:hypothetical protein
VEKLNPEFLPIVKRVFGAFCKLNPNIIMTKRLAVNIILDQFDKLYFPKKLKCSNFYDVLLTFKNVVSFTGTPFIYPVKELQKTMNKGGFIPAGSELEK